MGHMMLLKSICTAVYSTFEMFSSPFDIDSEEVPLLWEIKLVNLQFSEDLKSKSLFLTHLRYLCVVAPEMKTQTRILDNR